jgi:hypothetical protein
MDRCARSSSSRSSLDGTLLDEPERLGETFGISPGRVEAHFTAMCRVRDAESEASRRRDSIPALENPARSFVHARLGRWAIRERSRASASSLRRALGPCRVAAALARLLPVARRPPGVTAFC